MGVRDDTVSADLGTQNGAWSGTGVEQQQMKRGCEHQKLTYQRQTSKNDIVLREITNTPQDVKGEEHYNRGKGVAEQEPSPTETAMGRVKTCRQRGEFPGSVPYDEKQPIE